MPKLEWDVSGKRYYETGVENAVLYLQSTDSSGNVSYPTGVPWNGLLSVTETPSGAEATDLYADDIKYATLRSAETFGGTIEAYTYPDEFAECDGTVEVAKGVKIGQQARKPFGLAYKTVIGSDVNTSNDKFLIHVVYGCTASPSEKSYQTINDSPEAITLSWEFETVSTKVTGHKALSTIVFDTTKMDADKVKAVEDALFGSESGNANLPLPDALLKLAGYEYSAG